MSKSGTPTASWPPQERPSSSRSARVISRISSSKLVCGFQPRSRSALEASPIEVVDLGRAHERGVDLHVLLEVAETRLVEGDLAAFPAPSGPCRWRSRSPPGCRAGASATSLPRSPWRSPSRAGRRGCRDAARSSSPSLIAAACQVILRVTNSRPRRGELEITSRPRRRRTRRSRSRCRTSIRRRGRSRGPRGEPRRGSCAGAGPWRRPACARRG